MFAVAALLPMMALAQAKPSNPRDTAAIQQVTQRVRDFLANVPKNDPKAVRMQPVGRQAHQHVAGFKRIGDLLSKVIDYQMSVNIEPLCKLKCSSDSLRDLGNQVNASNCCMPFG